MDSFLDDLDDLDFEQLDQDLRTHRHTSKASDSCVCSRRLSRVLAKSDTIQATLRPQAYVQSLPPPTLPPSHQQAPNPPPNHIQMCPLNLPDAHQKENHPPPMHKPPPKCAYTATFSLLSLTHARLSIGSHPSIDEVFRGIMGASRLGNDIGKVFWSLPLSSYSCLVSCLDRMSKDPSSGLHITVQPLPDLALRILRASQAAHDDSELLYVLKQTSIPDQPSLWDRLMPFQRSGVMFGLCKGGRVIIGDEMGLGKTVQSLALLQCYRTEGPALIVCPSSLRGSWSNSIAQWLPNVKDAVQVIWKKTDLKTETGRELTICSYDLLKDLHLDLMQRKFSLVILDEAHYIKNATSKRSQAALPLCQKAKRAILLSGTPMLNRPDELTSLLKAVLPSVNIRDKEFKERYCEFEPLFNKFIKATNEAELHQLMQSVMIRRKKIDVLQELPTKRRQRIDLQLTAKELSNVRDAPPEAKYRESALAKVDAVKKYVAELLIREEGIKFLAFAHHTELLDGLEAQCRDSKVGYIRIDGATPQQSRAQLVDSFQTDTKIQVAVLSIKAAGTGLTLTAASLVIFAELTYVPGEILQAEDRVHRIGQQSSVLIQCLMAKGTNDDRIWASVQGKLDDVGNILDGKGEQMEISRSQGGLQVSAAFFSKRQADTVSETLEDLNRASASLHPLAQKDPEKQTGIRDFFQAKPNTLPSVSEDQSDEPSTKKRKIQHESIDLT